MRNLFFSALTLFRSIGFNKLKLPDADDAEPSPKKLKSSNPLKTVSARAYYRDVELSDGPDDDGMDT